MPFIIFFSLLFLLSYAPLTLTVASHRRLLHQSFSLPPTQPPDSSPSLPRFPSSKNAPPFFPFYPSPPPPPPPPPPLTSTNITSLVFPKSSNRYSKTLKFLIWVVLPVLLILFASLAAYFFCCRRRNLQEDDSKSGSRRFFTANVASPDAHKLGVSAASSEFLYLGTLINSRGLEGAPDSVPPNLPYRKLGSPELRPLPPLSRQCRRNYENAAGHGASYEEEEFYSPRGSSEGKEAEKSCSRTTNSSTPSYPFSNFTSPSPSLLSRSPSSSPVEMVRPIFSGGPIHAPPKPPPLPAAGFLENQVPVFVAPRAVQSKNQSVGSDSPAKISETSNSAERKEDKQRPKLKPLRWDKVRASSDRAMVWDQLKSSSFQLNEEMIETLFVSNAPNSSLKETPTQAVFPSSNQENQLLDPKKSQNIAILLRALNVTKEEVCEALLEGNAEGLGTELLETLLRMAPTKEEEHKLKDYKDDSPSKFGPAERFLKAVLDVPCAFKRVDVMLYIVNFDSEVKYLRKSFKTVESACEEMRTSRMFLKLLEAVLMTGNRMNVGTNRRDAHAFKLDTLLKLVDLKGTDGKTTLLHFVVQEIIRYEGYRLFSSDQTSGKTHESPLQHDVEIRKLGLQVVSGLSEELSNVKKAASMDSGVLSSYVSKFAEGIGKICELKEKVLEESSPKFNESMIEFLKRAEVEIIRIQAQESVARSLVKEITEYFHGNSAREEAHPFRIFMVVRDFLSTLDQVCKDLAKIERTTVSSARQFLMRTHTDMFTRGGHADTLQ